MSTIRSREELIKELQDKEIRDFFISEHINIGLSSQIRILRKKRGWTQKELADRLGKKQPWVNKIENNYTGFSLQTLKDLASVFDVALIVRFAPFGELVQWELALSAEKLEAASFEKDPYFQPPVTAIVGQGGFILGGEGIVSVSYPDTKAKGTLLYLDARQKKNTENKIDADQKEKDMPSYEHLARANQ